ncbi:flagellar protein FliT [Virgibacillus doumboii]|uniref:flagellar protein FliT n=1 Tax=Virgibacillus doumboii TaxID=2697503 RepID=UPI0013DF7377|nr:flagellar protein FliT [Virgibacillus doumboii]
MSQLHEIYDITKELEKVLNEKVHAKDRDSMIEQVNDLVEQRGQLLNKTSPPFTEAEKQLGKELVHLNENIQVKMNALFDDLKVEMKQVKKQKKSNRTYLNPYEDVKSLDGMYLDSKK